MRLDAGGLIVAVTDLDASARFYCGVLEAEVVASDGSTAMVAPIQSSAWLLALRQVGRTAMHPSSAAVGIRAVFFRTDMAELDGIEERLQGLGGFEERHKGEFYEMVSGRSPDRNALGFWASIPGTPVDGPTFVPPSVYMLDQ